MWLKINLKMPYTKQTNYSYSSSCSRKVIVMPAIKNKVIRKHSIIEIKNLFYDRPCYMCWQYTKGQRWSSALKSQHFDKITHDVCGT